MGRHVAPHIRDDVVATVERSARRAGWPLRRLIALLGIALYAGVLLVERRVLARS